MQVESVAWLAASMKIGTYALFFLLSIWFYLRYKEKGKVKFMIAAFLSFLASCFCKEQAVVLPLVLVAVDYLQGRSLFEKKVWLNKIPFLLTSLIFGIVTLNASGGEEIAQKVYDFQISERLIFATYSVGVYLFKLFIPTDLSFFYTYPIKGDIPAYFYLFPLLLIGLLYIIFKAYKKDLRWLVFGILFFLLNVALTSLTAVMSVRDVIMADRYVYMASLGVFFILISLLNSKKEKWSPMLRSIPLVMGVVFMIISMQRVKVFKNSVTLFTEVIEKGQYKDRHNPYLALPYNNRGIAYKRDKKLELAIKDYEVAIGSNPSYPNGYLNRGNIHFDSGEDDLAVLNYNKVLGLKPRNEKALSARGAIYAKRKQYDDALADLTLAIEIDPYFLDAYSNRALTYLDMGNLDEAIEDVSTYLRYSPAKDDMYEFRGYLYIQKKDYKKALSEFNQAIALNSNRAGYYFNRASAHRGLGNKSAALQDANKAKIKGYQVPQEFFDSLR
jgi:tetratricopeptide (TPR) repeat protein